LWVRADLDEPWEKRKRLVTTALESGADVILVKKEDLEVVKKLGAITLAAQEGGDITVLRISKPAETKEIMARSTKLRTRGEKVAILAEISGKELELAAVKAGAVADYLIISTKDWKVIPLENIIAELHGKGVKILAEVNDSEEAKTAAETLELGADGVVLNPSHEGPGEIKKTREVLEESIMKKLKLTPAKVTAIKPVGMGDRACVDTVSMMEVGEGMLVGSQAECLFLVHSESLKSQYVESRPFRVNAGPVHSYIMAPGGKTRYLSELGAGDEVLIVRADGATRNTIIGRVKIERRPLLLIEAKLEENSFRTIVQNAETINLVDKNGKPISVTKLKQGDEVLVHLEQTGRHFGVKVEETVVEK
jgi:3-dehydroquinate synthase II